jgi:hypothetical protein
MPLWRYVKGGVTFSPEEMAAMGKAFDGAVADLGIGPEDEIRREAVAQFILDYARADGRIDAARIRAATVRTLSDFAKRGGASD